jgi:hypothetical protein
MGKPQGGTSCGGACIVCIRFCLQLFLLFLFFVQPLDHHFFLSCHYLLYLLSVPQYLMLCLCCVCVCVCVCVLFLFDVFVFVFFVFVFVFVFHISFPIFSYIQLFVQLLFFSFSAFFPDSMVERENKNAQLISKHIYSTSFVQTLTTSLAGPSTFIHLFAPLSFFLFLLCKFCLELTHFIFIWFFLTTAHSCQRFECCHDFLFYLCYSSRISICVRFLCAVPHLSLSLSLSLFCLLP